MNLRTVIVSLLFSVPALILVFYKVNVIRIPLIPDSDGRAWEIEAKVTGEGRGRFAEISLAIPSSSIDFDIVSENFVSGGFPVATVDVDAERRAIWTGLTKKEDILLYYRAVVRSGSARWIPRDSQTPKSTSVKYSEKYEQRIDEFLEEVRAQTDSELEFVNMLLSRLSTRNSEAYFKIWGKKADSLQSSVSRIVKLLNYAKIPARRIEGISLRRAERAIPFLSWLEVYVDGEWRPYNTKKASWGKPQDLLQWRRGESGLLKTRGLTNEDVTISIVPQEVYSSPGGFSGGNRTGIFPLLARLPIETQAVLRILLVIPLGALVITVLRSVIGIRTFGTFMPVLMALAFRDTRLTWGIILFTSIVSLGLLARFMFDKLQLLLVPRLTATLTVVILLILLSALITDMQGLERGLSVALFPIVIITMAIERISIVWDELGAREAITRGCITLVAASVVYLIISNRLLEYILFAFPEILFVVLGISILLGRYTGYRLTELYRFREFSN